MLLRLLQNIIDENSHTTYQGTGVYQCYLQKSPVIDRQRYFSQQLYYIQNRKIWKFNRHYNPWRRIDFTQVARFFLRKSMSNNILTQGFNSCDPLKLFRFVLLVCWLYNWRNVVLLGTPLPSPKGITGVMSCKEIKLVLSRPFTLHFESVVYRGGINLSQSICYQTNPIF